MLCDLEIALAEIGLQLNAKKLSYVYGPHTPEMAATVQALVGECRRRPLTYCMPPMAGLSQEMVC